MLAWAAQQSWPQVRLASAWHPQSSPFARVAEKCGHTGVGGTTLTSLSSDIKKSSGHALVMIATSADPSTAPLSGIPAGCRTHTDQGNASCGVRSAPYAGSSIAMNGSIADMFAENPASIGATHLIYQSSPRNKTSSPIVQKGQRHWPADKANASCQDGTFAAWNWRLEVGLPPCEPSGMLR